MPDQIDQPYTYPSADAINLAKHNRLAGGGRFSLAAPANTPYVLVALRVASLGTEQQRRNLEAAIDAINGVDAVKVLVYGTTPPAADVPANHHIEAVGEIRFRIEPNAP